MKLKLIVLVLLGMTTAVAQTKKKTAAKPATTTQVKTTAGNDGIFATIETSKGNIELQLDFERTPITVANFISLAEGTNKYATANAGKPFYDGLKFHRVIPNFMIQGGDPAGNGSGGPGYAFKDETSPEDKFDKPGILAMANAGPATNGSQFFITHKDTPWLNGKHTIFGHVVKGQNVVDAIAQNDLINKVKITRNGAAAKAFDAVKVFEGYYAGKADEDKKMAEVKAHAKKMQDEAAAKAKDDYKKQYGQVMADKVASLAAVRKKATKTESGLEYSIVKADKNKKKPADGSTIYIHYAGYLEDGSLFDSSYADVNKAYGKFDENRGAQNGYQPFPFTAGKKDGLIPGFIEAIEKMNVGDKLVAFIPSNLGYGASGAGNVIPPNSNIIFEIELLDAMPAK